MTSLSTTDPHSPPRCGNFADQSGRRVRQRSGPFVHSGWSAAAGSGGRLPRPRPWPRSGSSPGRPAPRPVRFALRAPASTRVTLTGDFNDWNAGQLPLEDRSGEWSVTLRLRPGRYRYAFIVDGAHWVADPHGATATDDDFGTPTSVITVAR